MAPAEVASYALHTLFAGLWTGSVLFVTVGVLPVARDGTLDAAPLETVAARLATVSRASALVLLLTGAHIGVVGYSADSLLGTLGGRLVVAMLACWFMLAGSVEVATSRLVDGSERAKVREPAREARPILLTASALSVLLLVISGLLAAGNAGFL